MKQRGEKQNHRRQFRLKERFGVAWADNIISSPTADKFLVLSF